MARVMAKQLKRGQSALEFLYATGLVLAMFAAVLAVFFVTGNDADSLSAYSEANRVCGETAAQVSSVAAAGDGASAAIGNPRISGNRNYTLHMNGKNRQLSVIYGQKTAGCMIATSNITNGTSDSFYFDFGAMARNVGGGVVVG